MRKSFLILPAAALALAASPGTAYATAPRHGDLVITEIAANPALPEPGAEFVVVDNVSDSTLRIDGLRLTDALGASRGVVPSDTSLDPGQRVALQASRAYACSPAPHHAVLGGWPPLNNDGDTVALERADGAVLDRVAYPRDGFALDGRSRRVHPAYRTAAGNDDWARWALSAGPASPCAIAPARPGVVRFAATEVAVAERGRSVRLTVRRDGGTNGRVAVPWRTVDGSALAGRDYRGGSGTVSFGATQTSATFDVAVLDDARDEARESFTVALGAPTAGASAAEPSRAVVRIADDDAPAPAVLTPVLPASPGGVPWPGGPGGGPGAPGSGAASGPGGVAGGGAGGPGGTGTARASLAVAAWQPVLRRRRLNAAVACDPACHVTTRGTIALGRGRRLRLKSVARQVGPGARTVMRLRVPHRRGRTLRRALARRGWLRATVTATPPGGGATVRRRVRVR